MSRYDAIIVGLGGTGSAAAFHLARRGARVLGFDRYAPPHDLGSTHGRTRIIREAYFEHPSYVPLVRRAYELWRETEESANAQLFLRTSGLMIGRPDSAVVAGALESARTHAVPHELLSAMEVRRRFPALNPARDMVAVLEERAGILFPERCVEAHLRLAAEAGAVLRTGERVIGWTAGQDAVEVQLEDGSSASATRIVLALGPWVRELAGDHELPLSVERQQMHWFRPLAAGLFDPAVCPVAVWEDSGGTAFATFPDLGDGVKIGIHHSGESCTPANIDRTPRPGDQSAVRDLLSCYMPEANGELLEVAVCMYTNTPDQHFVIDTIDPGARVVLASPCSGHGFKFSSAIGEAVAAIALGEEPAVDLSLFRLARFQPS